MKIYSYKDDQIIKNNSLIEALEIDIPKDKVITIVGAGGKTSTIFKLGEEISNLNKKTLITTTTHMALEDDFILVDNEVDLKTIEDIFKTRNLVKIGKKESDYKIKGLDFDILEKVISICDNVLIEGDGSKRLPLKVPRENEPVIIKNTNLVIGIIGIDCLDKKIKNICHRPESVANFLGKSIEQNIECGDIVKIATSKKGLKKDVSCKYKVVINKVDSEKYLGICKKIAALCQNFDVDVVFTSYK
ncbi:MAG: selenium cofactor biosynthesis protein YqeC [Intestinibacter sp.]|uniref:selenium cofactor biosynthesis protein YqeC n=1 Tax=Intestinibacter sp. TaxID=1965304 RepID=UPI003F176A6B